MKIGDRVEIITIPDSLPGGMGTREMFAACLGRVFPIAGFQGDLIELEVGDALGQQSFMHSIWIEPQHVRPAN